MRPKPIEASLAAFFVPLIAGISASAGQWGAPIPMALPPGAQSLVINDVSCVDALNCMAVGTANGHPVSVLKTGGFWQPPIENAPSVDGALLAVSCVRTPAPANEKKCVAIGYRHGAGPFAMTALGGVWGTPLNFPDSAPPNTLAAIDCVDSTYCMAVGTAAGRVAFATITNDVLGPLTNVPDSGAFGGGFNGVSCVSANNCVAVGVESLIDQTRNPIASKQTNGTWAASLVIALPGAGDGEANGVDCVDLQNCVAVGKTLSGIPFRVQQANGAWSPAVLVPLPPATPLFTAGNLTGVSCVDNLNCTAVGKATKGAEVATSRPIYLRLNNGNWDSAATLLEAESESGFEAISCTHLGNCTGVGQIGATGFHATESNSLLITATSDTINLGSAIPTIQPGYSGFVAGESEADLITPPTCTTTATATSPVGTYPTSCSGAQALNYTITYASGTIHIVPVPVAPAFTSGMAATFVVGQSGSFLVRGTGEPLPTFAVTNGLLPGGVTLSPAGLLAGIPNADTAGTYNITITASNGELPNATQAFTLTVNAATGVATSARGCDATGSQGSLSMAAFALLMGALLVSTRLRRVRVRRR